MALLDDLFSALSQPQTPWAQEVLRRMQTGEDLGGADAAVANRQRKAAPKVVDRQAPPPSADVRNPGRSADPFQSGPARIATVEDIDARAPQSMAPQDFAARPEIPAAGGQTPAAAPVAAPTPSPARSAPEMAAPRTSTASAPATFQGADVLNRVIKGVTGIDLDIGGEKERTKALIRQAVLANGGSQVNAELAARDPRVFLAMMPTLTANKTQVINNKLVDSRTGRVIADYGDSARQGPDVKEIDGPYGQKIKVMWDAKAGQYVPLRVPGDAAPQPPAQPAPAPAAAVPSSAPTAEPAAPKAAVVPPAPGAVAQPASAAPRTQGEFRIGAAVTKAPDGYVHRLSSDGTGYLYTADGQPVFEAREGVDARAKSIDKDREKAVGAVDTIRRVMELRAMLDKPLGFDKPYQTRAGITFNTVGDVVGPWSKPEPAPAGGGIPGQIIASMTNLPAYGLQFVRNVKGQYDPEVAQINRARNEVDTALTSLQAARVKELFGSSQLSDADREAAARTVGSMTAQDAKALKAQMEIGERDSFNNLKRGLDLGLIKVDDIPPEILSRGVQLGIFKGRGR